MSKSKAPLITNPSPPDGSYAVMFTGRSTPVPQEQELGLCFVLFNLLARHPTDFHHGDCINADALAHLVVQMNFPHCWIHIHPGHIEEKRAHCERIVARDPALMHLYEPMENLARNAAMAARVTVKALIACPETDAELRRSGSWYTVRTFNRINIVHKLERPIYIVGPSGQIKTRFVSQMNERVEAEEAEAQGGLFT